MENPTELEQQILKQAKSGISTAIAKVFEGYDSPLSKLAKEVVADNGPDIKDLMTAGFKDALADESFKEDVKQEFKRKTAKLIVSQMSGELEKAVNVFRTDPTLKAKLIVAIESFIDANTEN